MTARNDWDEVGDRLGALALKLKLHFEQATGGEGERTRQALDAVREGVEKAFDGLRSAVDDPAIRDDVREVATGLREALGSTFAELGAQLQGRRERGGDDPAGGEAPPVDQ